MSDHWISAIPKDPYAVPTSAQIEAATAYLSSIAPDSETVTFDIDERVQFRDCGENLESISCPFCRASLDRDWWSDRMSEDHDGIGFKLLPMALPCCSNKASLNELVYVFDQGFSRFILEAMNPNVGTLGQDKIGELSKLLSQELRIIYQHI